MSNARRILSSLLAVALATLSTAASVPDPAFFADFNASPPVWTADTGG